MLECVSGNWRPLVFVHVAWRKTIAVGDRLETISITSPSIPHLQERKTTVPEVFHITHDHKWRQEQSLSRPSRTQTDLTVRHRREVGTPAQVTTAARRALQMGTQRQGVREDTLLPAAHIRRLRINNTCHLSSLIRWTQELTILLLLRTPGVRNITHRKDRRTTTQITMGTHTARIVAHQVMRTTRVARLALCNTNRLHQDRERQLLVGIAEGERYGVVVTKTLQAANVPTASR